MRRHYAPLSGETRKSLEKWLSSLPRHVTVATVMAAADTVGTTPAVVHTWLLDRGCTPIHGRFLIKHS